MNSISLIHRFFANCDLLDYMVLRPLSHIYANWELRWDMASNRFVREDSSFVGTLNELIDELAVTQVPDHYHDNEDALAAYVRDRLGWSLRKEGRRWVGADYQSILEQGGFGDIDEQNLTIAAAGRIHAAIIFGQLRFDEMEDSHRNMLAAVLSIILYHRAT